MSDQLEMGQGSADPEWALVKRAIDSHVSREISRHEKMWAYYRNPLELVRSSGIGGNGSTRGWYRSAQEVGLPTRIVGSSAASVGVVGTGNERGRREVVIENDIGWRVQTMVDFMFGSPVRIESLAKDKKTKRAVEDVLETVWEASGGIAMMQDMATLGHVFGHVDLLIRVDEESLVGSRIWDASRWISIEPIDARRGVAVMSDSDYREIVAYGVHVQREVRESKSQVRKRSGIRFGKRTNHDSRTERTSKRAVTEVFTADGWSRFVDGQRVEGDEWKLNPGSVPIVHVQNLSQPFVYSGIGEVEALVGLQDELNTRLSDRASRVTMQSFKS